MTTIHAHVERALAFVLSDLGLSQVPAVLVPCPRAELGDAAVQAALPGARLLKRPPIAIATEIADALRGHPAIASAEAVPPGYVNLRFSDAALVAALEAQAADPANGITPVAAPERIVIDFGGPNVGKAMHVGHLRSFVIGESLRRLLGAVGHRVVSDIHLGDWGLPAGMILGELRERDPGAPWFAPGAKGPFPDAVPVGEDDLVTLYPTAAAACKEDEDRMAGARALTAALQEGAPGPSALWRGIVEVAHGPVRRMCARLDARFDLFLGESDVQGDVPAMLDAMRAADTVREDGNALLVDVARETDKKPLPPLVVSRGDGSSLYATTDLATAAMRVRDQDVQRIVYVVDNRQALHFEQVARAAAVTGVAPGVAFEHVGFGTVNGPDGRPFRTREGGTMRLEDLLDAAHSKALTVIEGREVTDPDHVAETVGIAALRFADLTAHRLTGYVLDLDRALSFEGNTGPYVLYALVRLRTLLAKAGGEGGPLVISSPEERALALANLRLDAAVHRAVAARSPHELVAYAFELAGELARFYVACPVGGEPDPAIRASRVTLCRATERSLAVVLGLLGCEVPAAM